MAKRSFLDCGETKCSVYRTGPQFGTLVLWIIINIFLCLPCLCSTCLGLNITVAVEPEGDIYVQYGKPLEILCVAENYSYHDLEFSVGGKVLPSTKYNETARRLFIERPEKQVNTYVCTNNVTSKRCVNRVLVDMPPANVTDFQCISKNLEELYCSWNSTQTKSFVSYTVTFFINGNTVTLCTAKRVPRVEEHTWYCKWNTTSKPRYRQQEEKYEFQLTSKNVFGTNVQNIIVDHFAVVKPDPPYNLKVISNGTHSVVLQWSIPHNMVDFLPCGVDYRIEYQIAKIDDITYFRSIDASSLPPKNKTNRFTISNLPYAHMQYEVRIYMKSKKAPNQGFWSDFSYLVFYTASERPSRPPDTAAGAFEQALFEGKRVINVYWKQLEEYEESGANFTYKVVVSQDNSNNTHTLFADKNKSLSFVSLDHASLGAINVRIWSTNMNGSSVNSSSLYIPPATLAQSLTLSSFTKLAYENGTYELSWAGQNKIDNYTLFWCQHNTTKICTGRMNFTVLDPHKNNHVIDLPVDNTYQFAISANNGSSTSGMVWAKCDISKDGIAMYGFPVKLDYDAPGKSFVKLRWSMDCTLQNGTITGYQINYCPVIGTGNQCDNTVGNKSVKVEDPKKMELNVTGLLPFRTYQFRIALYTIYGLKTIDSNSSTATTTTSEDTPTNPRNVTISDVKSNSLIVSWDPPLHRNGNIGKYVIYNYGQELYVDKVSGTDLNSRKVNVTGLLAFTNYSLTVQACNIPIGLCSVIGPNDAVFVRTRIGPPSKLKAPTIKNSPDTLLWDTPTIPGGTVDMYQVRRVKDQSEPDIFNGTNLALTHCDGVSEAETYQVRAVNFDEDPYHGVLADSVNVILPKQSKHVIEYPGEWSEPSTVACRSRGGVALTLVFIPLIVLIGVTYGSIKLFKKYKKMEDIKPVLPNGLGIPEKDIAKYPFGGWNPTNKDEKPSSDEVLLLPSNNSNITTSDSKQKTSDICGASDQTDSTALSDSSRSPIDRQTSDESSDSSLRLDIDPVTEKNTNIDEQDDETCSSVAESSKENSPYLDNKTMKKNPSYVETVIKPVSGYVQSVPAPPQSALTKTAQPTTSSYVMAGLPSPTFTNAVPPLNTARQPPSSGYVRPEDVQVRSTSNLPKLGPSPTKVLGPESLPSMPSLPPSSKHGADSSYIQLQSLPSLKPSLRNTVPLKPPTSSGYVSPGDAVINKHLKNILSAGQPISEESAILDPAMSPDAYCRFSWSTDPANDNLHSLLSESPATNAPNY